MDTITMDGGWNEENCNIALNCFLAGHKISPNLKYQEERNQDGYFHFITVYCLSPAVRDLPEKICVKFGYGYGYMCRGAAAKKCVFGNAILNTFCTAALKG